MKDDETAGHLTDFALTPYSLDPIQYLRPFYYGGGFYNMCKYDNPAVNQLVDQASTTADPEARQQLLAQALTIIRDDAVCIWSCTPRLLDAVPEEHLDLVLLALTTGFRRNELLGLQWEWIDFGKRRIDLRGQLYWRRVGDGRQREATIVRCKYDSEREVPLFGGVAQLLGRRRQATGFVFVNARTGKPWRERQPTDVFLEASYERAGLRRAGRMWHQLRHTYASVLAAGGVKRHEVEQLMGHRAAGTTSIYTHLFREAYEDVEQVLQAIYGTWLRGHDHRQTLGATTTPRRTSAPERGALRRF
jgi:integrase